MLHLAADAVIAKANRTLNPKPLNPKPFLWSSNAWVSSNSHLRPCNQQVAFSCFVVGLRASIQGSGFVGFRGQGASMHVPLGVELSFLQTRGKKDEQEEANHRNDLPALQPHRPSILNPTPSTLQKNHLNSYL